MVKSDWGNPKRIWGLEPYYDPGRCLQIYDAIKGLNIKSVLDVACGTGFIVEGLSWVIPAEYEQFDIEEYPEWGALRIKPQKMDLFDYIKTDKKFDLVLFLNSYRNWDDEPRQKFNDWVKRNAKYFITSGPGPGEYEVIGTDVKDHELKLYKL